MSRALPPAVHWRACGFEALGVHGLYDVLRLRCEVFILEQGPYLDTDGLDACSQHVLGRDAQGELLAYLRIVAPGAKYAEPSIGRVSVALRSRGLGLGREVVRQGFAEAARLWPGQGNRISAQARLQGLYEGLGYRPVGEPYLEDGIPHLEMCRPWPLQSA